jgi:protein involved in polysaccharide export with SLBB domain
MQAHNVITSFGSPGPRRARTLPGVAALVCALLSGCAAVSDPVGDAIPVHRLPPEVHGVPREDERTIPLPLLRQKAPDVYRLAPGDVLGVWIESILGERNLPPPLHLPDQVSQEPAFGYPIPVAADGTVTLPLVPPIKVEGLTVVEAQREILLAYTTTRKILQPGAGKVLVTLMRPRTYHVLVVRQDTGAVAIGPAGITGGGLLGQTKRGTGYTIDLPAYQNDVLNALARTGGLPGLDAQNEVIIQRGSFADFADPAALRRCLEAGTPDHDSESDGRGANWIRIPLRLRPGEPPPFGPQDVVLQTGDIVFIEARDTEVFYTGGLLPPRQFALPRDYDLDVVEAISFVNGPLVNGGQQANNLSGNLIQPGIGFPSPSLVTVLRRTRGGGQIPIRIDLNRALRDRRERVLIQPGDVIILQQTPLEALAQYFTQVFHLDFLGTIIRQRDLTGTSTLNLP